MSPEMQKRFEQFSAKLRINAERKNSKNSTFPPRHENMGKLISAANKKAAEIENLNDEQFWNTTHQVIVGQIQECKTCGNIAHTTSGYYLAQTHSKLSAHRLRQILSPVENLETTLSIEGVILPTCIMCNDSPIVDDILSAVARTTVPNIHNQLSLFPEK